MGFTFELGVTVKDIIHGLEGVVIARMDHLTGCAQYCVQPRGLTKEEKLKDCHWFDEGKLVLQKAKQVVITQAKTNPGGPLPRVMPPRKY